MTLDELMRRVNEAYPDDRIELYYTKPGEDHGDTLAEFIVRELQDTFDPDASDDYQLASAAQHLETAVEELAGVIEAL